MYRNLSALPLILLCGIVMLLVTGCPLYLDHPAAPENACNFDAGLLGQWKTEQEEATVKKVSVKKGGATGYDITVIEAGSTFSEDTYNYRAYSTEIKGKNVLWCQPQGTGTKGYYYYVFALGKKKTLTLWEISDKDTDKAVITSTEEAEKLLEGRLETDAFLINPIEFKRD